MDLLQDNARQKRLYAALVACQRKGEVENFLKPSLENPALHQLRMQALKANLDRGALENLSLILARRARLLKARSFEDIYDEDDCRDFARYEEFTGEVTGFSGHYEWNGFKLPVREFFPNVFLHEHGIPLLQTASQVGDKAIIDGGASFGDSLLILRKYFSGPIYAFEPHPAMFELAKKTRALNTDRLNGKIIMEQLALYDKADQIVMLKDAGASSGIAENFGSGIPVRTTTLDSYVQRHGLEVGLIKLNIEGAEQPFLRGAINTISQQKPVLIISIYHSYEDFFDIKPFIEQLGAGYRFNFFKGIDSSVWASTLLLCESY